MRISKERMALTDRYQGKESESGWLVIDLKAMDLEGVQELQVNLDEVEEIRRRREGATTLYSKLAEKFGKPEP